MVLMVKVVIGDGWGWVGMMVVVMVHTEMPHNL